MSHRPRRPAPPLDAEALRALAAAYAARFQTTQVRLARYLERKLAVRGWAGAGEPPIAALVAQQVALGAVDDRAWAQARADALARRGLGSRRIGHALVSGGIDSATRAELDNTLDPLRLAEAYARRRRLGRFRAGGPGDEAQRRRDLMAMLRAGHDWHAAWHALGATRDPDDENAPDADGDWTAA